MWMWTLDDRLINMNLVESLELLEIYPEDADPDQLEAGALDPELFELVAVLASGTESLLFDTEDVEQAYLAYELLAAAVALGTGNGGAPLHEPLSVHKLLESHRNASN